MLALRTTNEADFIMLEDSALDKEADGFQESYLEFFETGNRAALKLLDGCTPTVFRVKRLSQKAFEHVMRQTHVVDQMREAVAFGLVSVTDWLAPGQMVIGREKSEIAGEQRIDKATMAKFFECWDLVKEVGTRVLSFQTLPPSKGQR